MPSDRSLRAAGLLAQHPHGLQLVQQVTGRLVDVQHAADDPIAAGLGGQCNRLQFSAQSVVVGECKGVDTGAKRRIIDHAGHLATIDEDLRLVAAQRLAVGVAGHQVDFGGSVGGSGRHGCLQALNIEHLC